MLQSRSTCLFTTAWRCQTFRLLERCVSIYSAHGQLWTVPHASASGSDHSRTLTQSSLCSERILGKRGDTQSWTSRPQSRSLTSSHSEDNWEFQAPQPKFDFAYLCDPANTSEIAANIQKRKGVGDIHLVLSKWKEFQETDDPVRKQKLLQELDEAAADVPNKTHPDAPEGEESQAKLLEMHGSQREFSFTPKTIIELGENLDILRTDHVSATTGHSTYYLKGALAELEQALIQYTVHQLRDKGFILVSVPDLVHPSIIEGCGFSTRGERTQVYRLQPSVYGEVCLAGTGEMPLAGYFMNKKFEMDELPQRVCTVSRCYRAETSDLALESGIYRVHQFTKVEMFAVTANETGVEGERMMEELKSIQTALFSSLGLHFRVLDMPSEELGGPAYRKYDMESWMPAKQFWGEVSSTSNCLDYQSRRLNIQYCSLVDGRDRHCQTVNGTACALPRMLMTILENNQTEDGSIQIPQVLRPYMDDRDLIQRPDKPLNTKWIELTKEYKNR